MADTATRTERIEVTEEEELLRIDLSGTLGRAELAEAHARISGEDGFAHPRRLWDLRGCRLDLSMDELRGLARSAREIDDGSPGRVAFVAGDDLVFGFARVEEALRETDAVRVRAFRDEEAAVDWLTGLELPRGPRP